MPALIRPALAVLMALSPLAAAPPAGAPPTAPPPASFSPHTVDPDLPGAAFAVTGNVVGDVRQEIVATGFGRFTTVPGGPPIPPSAGQLAVYRQSGHGLDTWSKQLVFDTDAAIPFPNEPAVSDVDRDGDRDIVVPGASSAARPRADPSPGGSSAGDPGSVMTSCRRAVRRCSTTGPSWSTSTATAGAIW